MKLYKADRTLCLYDEFDDSRGKAASEVTITIVLSTSALNPMKFNVVLEEVMNFASTIEETKLVKNVLVGSPHFYFVDLSRTQGKSFYRELDRNFLKALKSFTYSYTVGCPKIALSSQTQNLISATTNSKAI